MKSFDLRKALKGNPVVTRTGRVVTGMHQVPGVMEGRPSIVGVIDGAIYTWFPSGGYVTQNSSELGRKANQHTMDLFMGPEKLYANVYQETNGSLKLGSVAYGSASEAAAGAKIASMKYVTTVEYEV